MTRLTPVDPAAATGRAKALLDSVKARLGMTPNMMATMARSPAVLDAYLGFATVLAGGQLDGRMRERLALAVGEANGCNYCLSAHSLLGKGAGLSAAEIAAAREGGSADPRIAEGLRFAQAVVAERGNVTDADLARVRAVGYTDGEIGEIVANVALNIFTNYFNRVAATAIDFPVVKAKVRQAA